MSKYTGLEIAIVGMSCRFPDANTPEKFWNNLLSGKEITETFSREETLSENTSSNIMDNPNYVNSNIYLEGKENFDASFFGYLPNEAALMDPQMRLFHEVTWEALEDAGYTDQQNFNTGIFTTGSPNPKWMVYANTKNRKEQKIDEFTALQLSDISFLSTRVAYKLNLTGPSIFIQSACSSSLVVTHEASKSLLLGECDLAIAGGVKLNNFSKQGYIHQEGMILSKDGKCKPFDEDSSGTILGEGCGVVILKRLNDAIRDNDKIHAVIKGSAVNNDGSAKVGYTAPSVKGQVKVVKKALTIAAVNPNSINYIEAHGTATQLGDPIEIEALNEVYQNVSDFECAIGSVKSNIGHLDAAAGVAGLIKTVLCLKNKKIPPTLHYQKANPKIPFADGPFYVNNEVIDCTNVPLMRAGLSSFGIGGTNAHVVLEEFTKNEISDTNNTHDLLVLSAKSASSLETHIEELALHVKNNPEINISDVAFTLQKGRTRFNHRSYFVGQNRNEILAALEKGKSKIYTAHQSEELQHIIFLFSGQGSQYLDMGLDLYTSVDFFRTTLDKVFDIALGLGEDLKTKLFSANENNHKFNINQTDITQPLLFAIEYTMAKLLMNLGIQPDYMIGHSLGEYTAACVSGVLTLEDALRLVIKRGKLMNAAEKGSMISVMVSQEEMQRLIDKEQLNVEISVVNAANEVVVSGTGKEIDDLIKNLIAKEIDHREIKTSNAFHSRLMESILEEFEQEFKKIEIHPIQIPYISNVSGDFVSNEDVKEATYWSRHLRNCVQFHQGVSKLLSKGPAVCIEIGPSQILTNLVKKHELKTDNHQVVNTIRHPKKVINDKAFLYNKLGELWMYGVAIDWGKFYENQKRFKITLPNYSFDKKPYVAIFEIDNILNPIGIEERANIHTKDLKSYIYKPSFVKSSPLNKAVITEGTSIIYFHKESAFNQELITELGDEKLEIISIKLSNHGFKKISNTKYQLDFCNEEELTSLWNALQVNQTEISQIIYSKYNAEEVIPNIENIDTELESGYLPLCLIGKTLQTSGVKNKISLSVVANHVLKVNSLDIINPLQATLLSPVKVLPSEMSNLSSRLIDFPNINGEDELNKYAQLIKNEIFHTSSVPIVAYRYFDRWTETYQKCTESEAIQSNITIEEKKTYLVTGAFGGMGLNISRDIVLGQNANVVMVYRSFFPKEEDWDACLNDPKTAEKIKNAIPVLKEMKASGNQVHLIQADISNENEVRELITKLKKSTIEVDGLIWAAGEVDYGGIVLKRDKKEITNYLGSKVHGLLNFQEHMDFGTLDFISLFSSMGNVFYQMKFGQLSYNAANEFVDYYAQFLEDKYQVPTFAINWCDWLNVGMTYKIKKEQNHSKNTAEINTLIKDAIYPEQGISIFHHCLNNRANRWAVHHNSLPEALIWHDEYLKSTIEEMLPISEDTSSKLSKNVIEEGALNIFTDFFGKEDIQLEDDFFELGGDSLKAINLTSRLNKEFGTSLSLKDVYQYSTIHELIERISGQEKKEHITISKAPSQEYYPLTSQQKRMYFLQSLDSESIAYNEPKLYKFKESPDYDRLESALHSVIKKHKTLRTSFVENDGEIKQQINDTFETNVTIIKTSDLNEAIESFIKPFDLSQGPIFRMAIIELHDANYLITDSHHIVTDGPSNGIILKDLGDYYNQNQVEESSLDYIDYAVWKQSNEQQIANESYRDFWMEHIDADYDRIELPIDYKRSLDQNQDGDIVVLEVPKEGLDKMNQIKDLGETTMFTVLFGVFNVLLNRLSGSEDIIVGVPSSNRNQIELESIVGMFVNTLPIRSFSKGEMTFVEFISEIKQKVLDCFENQDYPFEEIVKSIGIERSGSRTPLFDTMFVFEAIANNEENDFFLEAASYSTKIQARCDLTLSVVEHPNKLVFNFVYAKDLWNESTVELFASYFNKIIHEVGSNPNMLLQDIDILSNEEKELILDNFNNTEQTIDFDFSVIERLNEQCQLHPKHTALIFENQEYSYEWLNEKSNIVANNLIKRTNGKATNIALMFDSRPVMVVAIVAVMKAGCTYIPIDPKTPDTRRDFIIDDCQAKIILTENKYTSKFQNEETLVNVHEVIEKGYESNKNVLINRTKDHITYIIYTSGTTGKPKGVTIKNESLINYALWNINARELSSEDSSIALVPYYFDGFNCNFYGTLLSGGTLVLVTSEDVLNTRLLASIIKKYSITNLACLPSLYGAILTEIENENITTKLRRIVLAGEKANAKIIEKHRRLLPDTIIENEYGPTEATVAATRSEFLNASNLENIGSPIWNTNIYILDTNKKLTPVGVTGEIYISGIGLSLGYINGEDLNKEAFMPNPFKPKDRLYRTGDLGKWNSDGSINLSGRKDTQVKIRGYRIEVSEIEHELSTFNGVNNVVAGALGEKGKEILVAFYTTSGTTIDKVILRDYLKERLPNYMVPNNFVKLDSIPITSNGKTDWKQLKSIEIISDAIYQEPTTEEEKIIADVWSNILEKEQIGIKDNFFSIGGDSIKSIQICSKLFSLGYNVNVKDIFENQTIQELSLIIKERQINIDQSVIVGKAQLSPIQNWFFNTTNTSINYFNQSVLIEFNEKVEEQTILTIFEKLVLDHDILRVKFVHENEKIYQYFDDADTIDIDLTCFKLKNDSILDEEFSEAASSLQNKMNIQEGSLLKLGLFQSKSTSRLLIVAHHLIIDGVSWRILFEDIDTLLNQSNEGIALQLPKKTNAYKDWSEAAAVEATSESFQHINKYWSEVSQVKGAMLPTDFNVETNYYKDNQRVSFKLNQEDTTIFSSETANKLNASVQEMLVAGLLQALQGEWELDRVKIDMEGHGRMSDSFNFNRTIGWFTSIYPVMFQSTDDTFDTLMEVKEGVRNIPNQGNDYLTVIQNKEGDFDEIKPEISFNFLGEFSSQLGGSNFTIDTSYIGNDVDLNKDRLYLLNVSGIVKDKCLEISIDYNQTHFTKESIQNLITLYENKLRLLITESQKLDSLLLSPSDLSYKDLSNNQIKELQKRFDFSDIFPLSPMQQGIYFHASFEEQDIYFQQLSIEIKGKVNAKILEETFEVINQKYDIFRTAFIHEDFDVPLQIVQRKSQDNFTFIDVVDEVKESSVNEVVSTYENLERKKPFNLKEGGLIRITALKVTENQYVLILSHHHILMDGWCIGLLFKDLMNIYHAIKTDKKTSIDLQTPPYSAFINWLEQKDQTKDKSYWEMYLKDYKESISLHAEIFNAPEIALQHVYKEWTLSDERKEQLNAVVQNKKVTVGSIFKAIWAIVLATYNNSDDIIFGCVNSGRNSEIEDVENIMGIFINNTPLRVKLNPEETFENIFQNLNEEYYKSEAHQYFPLYEIQKLSELGSDLFKTIFVFENYPLHEVLKEQYKNEYDFYITESDGFYLTNYDISFVVVPGDDFRVRVEYNNGKFSQRQIENLLKRVELVFDTAINNVEAKLNTVQFISEKEKALYDNINNTKDASTMQSPTILEHFRKQLENNPNKVALRYGENIMTYQELNDASDHLAKYLIKNFDVNDTVIGLYMKMSPNIIVSILAILKSGNTYLPIDVDYPDDRISYMLQNSDCQVLLHDNTAAINFETEIKVINIETEHIENNLTVSLPEIKGDVSAYIIYTSGSTGKPKGVLISHKALNNYIEWAVDQYINDKEHSYGLFTSIAFDLTVTSIFTPLVKGAEIVIYNEINALENLNRIVEDNLVTTIKLTPSHLKILASFDEDRIKDSKLNTFIIGGELFDTKLANTINDKFEGANIYNEYGPTEATVGCMIYKFDSYETGLSVPIGKPIRNMKIHLLDEELKRVPIGAKGQLYISGIGIANGYINNKVLSEERFIDDPFDSDGKLYKTGDHARLLSNGDYEFLGRLDDQVKINGHRIEINEIQSNIAQHEEVQQVAVMTKKTEDNHIIIAYYQSASDINGDELKDFLSKRIPKYMIPNQFIKLDDISLTINGKIDENQLSIINQTSFEKPNNEVEVELTYIWSEILKINPEEIGVLQDFIELGGHSLKAMILLSKINKAFGVTVSLNDFYSFQTIRSLSDHIQLIMEIQVEEDISNETENDFIEIDF
nr:hypothetical protein BACY1_00540 [Tenacibaculum mesophilum]